MVTVSAVIPTYNGTHYLAEAVNSALAQTFELLEIIVVDDGSPEDIGKILAPFPKVKHVRQDNAGPAAARNHGISMARGDFIALLDDDDVWHPTKTAAQVQQLIDNPEAALVYSYPELIDQYGKVIPNEAPVEFPSGKVYVEFLKKNRINTPSATLIRREVFKEIGMFDECRECISCEDYDLWLRIARCYEVVFCPGALVSYRVRNSGLSQNMDKHLDANLYLFEKMVSQHDKDSRPIDREFYQAFNSNVYETLRRFAFKYYYMSHNRIKAKSLLTEAMRNHPCGLDDLFYLIVFSMPGWLFHGLRKIKRKVSAATMLVGTRSQG